MTINVPRRCPWCDAGIIKRCGPEQSALLGTLIYECGTRLEIYAALFQVASTKHPEQSGWRAHDQI